MTAAFLVLGISQLSGWNIWIQLHAHFQKRLIGSPFRGSFEGWISLTFQFINLIFLLIFILFPRLLQQYRMHGGLALSGFVFLLALALQFIDISPTVYFSMILVLVGCSSVAGASLSALIGLASNFSSISSVPIISLNVGQSLVGLLVSGLAQWTDDVFIFLSIGITLGLAGLLSIYYVSFQLPSSDYETVHEAADLQQEEVDEEIGPDQIQDEDSLTSLAYEARIPILSVFLVFVVSLTIFPTIVSAIASLDNRSNFISKAFLVYNLSDLLGKMSSSIISLPLRTVFVLSILRLGFLPLFLLCNITLTRSDGSSLPHLFPVVFGDVSYLMLLAIFGFSNGFTCSLAFLLYSKNLNERNLSRVGDLMQFSLTMGLTLGSLASFFIQMISCNCNPIYR